MSKDLIGSYVTTRCGNYVLCRSLTRFQSYSFPTFITNKTMGCTRIKQYNCRFMIDRKCTRHNWCALRKFRKSSEVNLPLPDLHDLSLAFTLVILLQILTLGRLLISGTSPGKVRKTSTLEATVVASCTVGLLIIWPWPRLLLLRHRRSDCSLLLGWPKNPSA